MSKASIQRKRDKRKAEKKARKMANYVRFGPKEGVGSTSKKHRTVGEGDTEVPPAPRKPKTSPKGRARRRRNGLKWSRKTR